MSKGDLIFTNNDQRSITSVDTTVGMATNISSNVSTDTSSDITSDSSSNSSISTSFTDGSSPDMMGTVTNGGMTVMTITDMSSPNRLGI
jgi:hypothetical protein